MLIKDYKQQEHFVIPPVPVPNAEVVCIHGNFVFFHGSKFEDLDLQSHIRHPVEKLLSNTLS
jgi:hypothetical protein